MVKHYTIPVFIPELACPFQCVFCDQRKISGSLKAPDLDEVHQIIQKHLKTLPEDKAHIEIGFFGGNFTGISEEDQSAYLNVAQHYIDQERVHSIRLSTRPDYISEEVLKLLKTYTVKTIELGAQSMDEGVLIKSGEAIPLKMLSKALNVLLMQGLIWDCK